METEKAINRHPQKKERIIKLAERGKIAELLADLGDHEGVKILVNMMKGWVNKFNASLISQEEMTESERKEIMAARDTYVWLIELFPSAKKAMEDIKLRIQKYEQN